jgi:mono/diheme cytochrome c family protein
MMRMRVTPDVPYLMLAAVLVLISHTGASAQSSDTSFSSATQFMERDGESIYRSVCAACHMPDGTGAVGAGTYPALAKNKKLEVAGYPVFLVMNGRNAMPSFARRLDDEQIAAVVNYIRTHLGNGYTNSVSAEEVRTVRP